MMVVRSVSSGSSVMSSASICRRDVINMSHEYIIIIIIIIHMTTRHSAIAYLSEQVQCARHVEPHRVIAVRRFAFDAAFALAVLVLCACA
jgi:hypothetical protein